jgi:TonB-dependent receptor
MQKRTFLFLIMAIAIIKIHAQGVISGVVQDKNAQSLPGATLKLDKYNRYTISDQNGHYEFLNVPEGSYQVEVSYLGYEAMTKPATVSAGKNFVLKFMLTDGSIEGKEVIIQGEMLRGQAKALNQQKTNSRITNVISADQVGRFPDANIGDALKRVPGITMQNDQGEARNIIIRGLAPQLNSVTLNGNRIPSAEGDNRNVQMDLIPADMVSTIEVSKTLTADMDADAIGGSVELVTRATPNKQRISATVSGGYVPIREKAMYSGSLIYGNRFLNNKLGVVGSASIQNKDYGSDNIEAVWSKDDNSDAYVSQFDIRKYDVQRIRRSLSGALDYKIDASNSIAADIIYNWRWDRENRFRTRYKSVKPIYDDNDDVTGYTAEITRETKGGIDNDKNKNRRLEDQRIQSYALRGQHLVNQKLDLDWNLSYSKASEDRPNERYIVFNQKSLATTEDLSDEEHPLLSAAAEDMDKMKFKEVTENHNYTEEKEYAFKLNARIPFSVIEDQKGRLRFGVRGRFKDKERDNVFYSYEPVDGIGVLSSITSTSYWDGAKFNPGSKYVPGLFASASYLGNLDLKNPTLFTETAEPLEYLAQNYTAKEQVLAGYARWDQNLSNKTLLILGLRAENTHIDYTGNKMVEEDGEVTSEEKSKTNSYLNLFPSAILKYNVDDNCVLRAAFTTSLARPNYYSLVPYTSISQDNEEISVGNPELKATYSYNLDVMGEYYFKSVGILSGGLFYKKLKNFIYQYNNIAYTADNFSTDFPEITNPMEDGDEWAYSQYRNGKGVNVFGLEVAFQRKLDFMPTQFLRNLAVYLNYTYTKSKTKGIWDSDGNERTNISLPGSAPHMFNGSLAWENKKFSARASLNYTSSYIDALGGNEFSDSYYDKQLFLDVNASYKIKSQFRMFAEANNLTNQPLRYYQGSKERIMQLEYYKPTYNIGIKYDF